MNIYVIILFLSIGLVIYSYVLYPLLLLLTARFIHWPEPSSRPAHFPVVSIVVAAYNEERIIEGKIHNTLALNYPKDRIELLIGSDGSTDGTSEICRRHPGIRFFQIEPRQGKANVLNTLIPQTYGEIIVLSDANTMIEPEALIALVKHFDDPAVGGVCGRLVLTSCQQPFENTERTYWSYETWIKQLESRCYSTIGANGGIYAIRKNLFRSIPIDTIIDDFLVSLNLLEQNRRLVFEHDAVAYEEVCRCFHDEFRRKVRIGAGNLQILLRKISFFFKVHNFVAFAYLSHKVIRWLIPFLLIIIWNCSLLLSDQQPFYALFWSYNLTLLLSVAGMFGIFKNRFIKALSYLYSINLALLLGYVRYLLGRQHAAWQRTPR